MVTKFEMIKTVIELKELSILSSEQSYFIISEIVNRTIQGTNKNFDKDSGKYIKDIGENNLDELKLGDDSK